METHRVPRKVVVQGVVEVSEYEVSMSFFADGRFQTSKVYLLLRKNIVPTKIRSNLVGTNIVSRCQIRTSLRFHDPSVTLLRRHVWSISVLPRLALLSVDLSVGSMSVLSLLPTPRSMTKQGPDPRTGRRELN